MDQSIAAFKNTLTKIRTGRANPGLLDTVHVDYYGSLMPISQVANVALLDSRTISVQPGKGHGRQDREGHPRQRPGPEPGVHGRPDPRADAADVRGAPQGDDQAGAPRGRGAKIAVRNLRRDANEHVKKLVKDKTATEDDPKRAEADVQKADKHINEIDALVTAKEKEIMEV